MGAKAARAGLVGGQYGRAVKVELVGPDYAEVQLSVGDALRRSDQEAVVLNAARVRLRHADVLNLIRVLRRAASLVEAGRKPRDLARIYEAKAR